MKADHYREMKVERCECHFYAELILLRLSMLITYQLCVYFKTENNLILSEKIAMNEISKKIWKLWQARNKLEWSYLMEGIIKKLARIGRKNIKKTNRTADQWYKRQFKKGDETSFLKMSNIQLLIKHFLYSNKINLFDSTFIIFQEKSYLKADRKA